MAWAVKGYAGLVVENTIQATHYLMFCGLNCDFNKQPVCDCHKKLHPLVL